MEMPLGEAETPDTMNQPALPLIESCDQCAACCRRTPIPPFQPGEEAFWNVPDALLEPIRERVRRDEHFDLLACVWLDPTTLRCRHYDLRPQACRDFERGSDLCRLSRDDEGL
jgi:Fe-S-cluster containining protein